MNNKGLVSDEVLLQFLAGHNIRNTAEAKKVFLLSVLKGLAGREQTGSLRCSGIFLVSESSYPNL